MLKSLVEVIMDYAEAYIWTLMSHSFLYKTR